MNEGGAIDAILSLLLSIIAGSLSQGGLCNIYTLLTKCEVKMAGHWPSSIFLRFYKNAKKERGQYPAILTEQGKWPKNYTKEFRFCGNKADNPLG